MISNCWVPLLANALAKLVHPVSEVPAPGEALADVGGVNVHAGPAIAGLVSRH